MATAISPVITDAGLAAAINAQSNGLSIAITHIALGTGKYTADVATVAGMTAMAARKEAVTIGAGTVSGTGGFRVTVKFAAWEGTPNPYDATELAFYAGDPASGGVLFAVYSHPSEVIVQRNALAYVASFAMQLTRVPAGSVVIQVDPGASEALALMSQHEQAADPHPRYVKKAGDTSAGPQLGVTAPQHADAKEFATTQFVKRTGVSYPSEGGLGVAASIALTPAHLGRWLEVTQTGQTVTMPLAADCPIGGTIDMVVQSNIATVVASANDVLISPTGAQSPRLILSRGDCVRLSRNGVTDWRVLNLSARLPAGMVSYFPGNAAPAGWIKLNGSILSRSAYPDLWAYAQAQGVVTDSQWWSNGYTGRFSSGTDGLTFRIPDGRGTFLRSTDDGRGLDAGREWGTFQDQSNMSHVHGLNDAGHAHNVADSGHVHGGSTDTSGVHNHITSLPYKPNDRGAGPIAMVDGISQLHGSLPWPSEFSGAHKHNLTIFLSATGVGIYNSLSNISMQAQGGEARPRNLSMALCIKF